MQPSKNLLSTSVLLILIGLLIPASIAIHRIHALGLPISAVTAAAACILPVATGISLRGAQSLTRRSYGRGEGKPIFSRVAVILMALLFVYDSAIGTLSLTHMTPPSELVCGLERNWAHFYSSKDSALIRRIQERHQCCGFNSPLDRAWPFPSGRTTVAACLESFARDVSCRDGWRQDEQITAGLMLLVALVTFLLKIIVFLFQSRATLSQAAQGYASLHTADEDVRVNGIRRRIQGQAYHDDPPSHEDEETAAEVLVPSAPANEITGEQTQAGHLVQASGLRGGGNEWRDI